MLNKCKIVVLVKITIIILIFFTFCIDCRKMKNNFKKSKQSPAVSAVLIECPKPSTIKPKCESKIMVNIRINPGEQMKNSEKYLILDEVYNQKKQTKAKLLSPYWIEISTGEPILMYPLKFLKTLQCPSCENANNTRANKELRAAFSAASGSGTGPADVAVEYPTEHKGFNSTKGQDSKVFQAKKGKEGIKMIRNEKPTNANIHLVDEEDDSINVGLDGVEIFRRDNNPSMENIEWNSNEKQTNRDDEFQLNDDNNIADKDDCDRNQGTYIKNPENYENKNSNRMEQIFLKEEDLKDQINNRQAHQGIENRKQFENDENSVGQVYDEMEDAGNFKAKHYFEPNREINYMKTERENRILPVSVALKKNIRSFEVINKDQVKKYEYKRKGEENDLPFQEINDDSSNSDEAKITESMKKQSVHNKPKINDNLSGNIFNKNNDGLSEFNTKQEKASNNKGESIKLLSGSKKLQRNFQSNCVTDIQLIPPLSPHLTSNRQQYISRNAKSNHNYIQLNSIPPLKSRFNYDSSPQISIDTHKRNHDIRETDATDISIDDDVVHNDRLKKKNVQKHQHHQGPRQEHNQFSPYPRSKVKVDFFNTKFDQLNSHKSSEMNLNLNGNSPPSWPKSDDGVDNSLSTMNTGIGNSEILPLVQRQLYETDINSNEPLNNEKNSQNTYQDGTKNVHNEIESISNNFSVDQTAPEYNKENLNQYNTVPVDEYNNYYHEKEDIAIRLPEPGHRLCRTKEECQQYPHVQFSGHVGNKHANRFAVDKNSNLPLNYPSENSQTVAGSGSQKNIENMKMFKRRPNPVDSGKPSTPEVPQLTPLSSASSSFSSLPASIPHPQPTSSKNPSHSPSRFSNGNGNSRVGNHGVIFGDGGRDTIGAAGGDGFEGFEAHNNGVDKIYGGGNYFVHNGKDKFSSGSYRNFGDNSILNKKPTTTTRSENDNTYTASIQSGSYISHSNEFRNINSRKLSEKQDKKKYYGNKHESNEDEYDYYDNGIGKVVKLPQVVDSIGLQQASSANTNKDIERNSKEKENLTKENYGIQSPKRTELTGKQSFYHKKDDKRARDNQIYNNIGQTYYDDSSVLINSKTTRNEPVDIIFSEVPSEYLPNPVPLEHILNDPNLNTNDKINVMEIIDPRNEFVTKNLRAYKNEELQNTYPDTDVTEMNRTEPPIPLGKDSLISSENFEDSKKINKRSYIIYDDLTMRDTYDDYNDIELGGDIPSEHQEEIENLFFERNLKDRSIGNNKEEHFNEREEILPKEIINSVDDVWYSVFNMSAPLQFLTIKVRIFKKRGNSWYKIAPSVTLSSLSKTYVSDNLSIMFSSHANPYNLQNALNLENYKLIFPNKTKIIPKDILLMKEERFNIIKNKICQKHKTINEKFINNKIYTIDNFGNCPQGTNLIGKCKNNENSFCLNMIEEEMPAYKLSLEIPFQENALFHENIYKVQITNIIVDGSSFGSVKIMVSLINKSFRSHKFTIIVADDCPVILGGDNRRAVQMVLTPHRGEIINFLLPLVEIYRHPKYFCEVQVRNTFNNQVVARRQMTVQSGSRCFCIWYCACNCIVDIASRLHSDSCKMLQSSEEEMAGFVELQRKSFLKFAIPVATGGIFIFFITLGLLKGVFGFCISKIDRWKYDYIQSIYKYDESSRARRFFFNAIFFIVLPFVAICKCCMPTEEDLLLSSTTCSAVQYQFDSYEFDDDEDADKSDDEDVLLVQGLAEISSEKQSRLNDENGEMNDILFKTCEKDNEDEEDIDYVINTLQQSRDVIEGLNAHYSEELDTSNRRYKKAEKFVRKLVNAKIVYRVLNVPLGNAIIPANYSYSIRGYFIPVVGPGYQFVTAVPLKQHWKICRNINSLRPIIPPITLVSKDFRRDYANKMDVLETRDLRFAPSAKAPCINVMVQNISMYEKSDESSEETDHD